MKINVDMRTNIFYKIALFAWLLSAIFISCDRDENEHLTVMQEVRFSIVGDETETKSTQTGNFDEDDRIGVFAVEHTSTGLAGSPTVFHSNLQYRFDGTEFRPAAGVKPIRFNGKPMDFYVYAPYSVENNDIRSIKYSVVNQDTESGWKKSDFVTAVNTTGIKEGEVPLHFYHKFATVRLNVQEIPGITGVYMKSVKSGAVLNFADNKAVVTSSANDLKMLDRGSSSGTRTYDLTIPVQSIGSGQELFVLQKSTDADVKCLVQSGKTLSEGCITLFGIDLIMDVSFTPFPAYQGSATGNGKYAFNSNCTIVATPQKGYHFTGWYENETKLSDNASYTFPVLTNRMFTPTFLTDTTYGEWVVSVSGNPTTIASTGGSSTITSSAVRDVFVNGVKTGTEPGTPSLSRDNSAFTLSGNSLSVGNNPTSSQRTCVVTASIDGRTATCSVTQAAGVIVTYQYTFSTLNWQVSSGSAAGSHTVSITSYKTRYENGVSTGSRENVGYSLSRCDSWISANNGPSFSWSANTSTYSRTGSVYWVQNESGKTDYATVEQSGVHVPVITTETSYEISINPTSHTFASTGGSKAFSVSCTKVVKTFSDGVLTNTDRTAYSGYSTSVSGTGFSVSGTTVTASKNNSTAARSGRFTVSVGGYSSYATLNQEGAFDIDTEV